MNNIAIIPIKGDSTRILKKNFFDFFGKPMFVYTYEAAKQSGLFCDIVISTDSQEVINICEEKGIKVPFKRPKSLASDQASLNDVCLHALGQMKKTGKEYDNLCLLWATAPMRDWEDIAKAYEMLIDLDDTEAVIGVTDNHSYYSTHKVNSQGYIEPLIDFEKITAVRTQDVPRVFVDNGSMSWVKLGTFYEQKTWMPKKSRGYYMPRHKSVDLDTPEDLEMLLFYFSKYRKKQLNNNKQKTALPKMKKVFFDTEFTGGGVNTSLISIGMVSDCNKALYLEFNDYDRSQVTPWIEKNILGLLEGGAIDSVEARKRIEQWFNDIAPNQQIQLICPGKGLDSTLLFDLWADPVPPNTLREVRGKRPQHIDHERHLDMETIFLMQGIDSHIDRVAFAEADIKGQPHHALYDALILKKCWEKLNAREAESTVN